MEKWLTDSLGVLVGTALVKLNEVSDLTEPFAVQRA